MVYMSAEYAWAIVGVFSTNELAEKYVQSHSGELSVQTFMLDSENGKVW